MKRCIVVGCGGRGSYWTNTVLAQMKDRVRRECPPPPALDFRMFRQSK